MLLRPEGGEFSFTVCLREGVVTEFGDGSACIPETASLEVDWLCQLKDYGLASQSPVSVESSRV